MNEIGLRDESFIHKRIFVNVIWVNWLNIQSPQDESNRDKQRIICDYVSWADSVTLTR